jgi:hypothetical protein
MFQSVFFKNNTNNSVDNMSELTYHIFNEAKTDCLATRRSQNPASFKRSTDRGWVFFADASKRRSIVDAALKAHAFYLQQMP